MKPCCPTQALGRHVVADAAQPFLTTNVECGRPAAPYTGKKPVFVVVVRETLHDGSVCHFAKFDIRDHHRLKMPEALFADLHGILREVQQDDLACNLKGRTVRDDPHREERLGNVESSYRHQGFPPGNDSGNGSGRVQRLWMSTNRPRPGESSMPCIASQT